MAPRLLGLSYELLIGEAELCRRGGRSPRIDPLLLALLAFVLLALALLHLLEEDAHRLRRVVDDSWAMDAVAGDGEVAFGEVDLSVAHLDALAILPVGLLAVVHPRRLAEDLEAGPTRADLRVGVQPQDLLPHLGVYLPVLHTAVEVDACERVVLGEHKTRALVLARVGHHGPDDMHEGSPVRWL